MSYDDTISLPNERKVLRQKEERLNGETKGGKKVSGGKINFLNKRFFQPLNVKIPQLKS